MSGAMEVVDCQVGTAPSGWESRAARIESITPFLVQVGKRNQLIVKLVTEDGLYGWGESGLSGRERAVSAAIDHFAAFLIGQDSRAIGRIWQECYRSHYFEGGRVLTAAISAIDIALHDVLGKRLGVPVHQLLGGRQRHAVPTFASTMGQTREELAEQAAYLVSLGWDSVRIYPSNFDGGDIHDPRIGLGAVADDLVHLRKKLGKGITIGIDLHHRLSVAEAASFCNMLPAGTLDFLEEPIRSEAPEAYAALRRMTSVPFAIGEEFSSKWQAAPFIEQGLTQYMRLDICNIGGFTEAMKVAGWSERFYIDLMPHNPLGPICTAATVHMSAAVPNFSWLETRQSPVEDLGFHDPEIFPVQVKLQGPVYPVPDTPGLGVDVDEAAIKNQRPAHVEAPHLRRSDGSVTNW